MNELIFAIFIIFSAGFFYLFIRGPYKFSPLWLMLSAWMAGVGIPQLNLSDIEKPWTGEYWFLITVSLISFTVGFFFFKGLFEKYPFWQKIKFLNRENLSVRNLRIVIYALTAVSFVALYMFYTRAGNLPLLAQDTDVFRFVADEQVPGMINYAAQFARLFLPLSFFLILFEGFSWRRHWDLAIVIAAGTISILLFASRTQIFFVDLWIMGLYLLMRKPNWKQALKFYPTFLIICVIMLALVPLYRQYKSYGSTDYLAGVTAIDSTNFNPIGKALLPIYVGVSFNQQALLHANEYYKTHPIQKGLVTLDPFTNIVGLDQLKSEYDLGAIFKSWWNTGTYLFPFVQDFGRAAFYFIPFLIAGFLTLAWRYWEATKNFLSINLYAYAVFFMVMTIYLSFTVRAEMYLDFAVLFLSYLFVSWKQLNNGRKL